MLFNKPIFDELFEQAVAEPLASVVVADGSTDIGVANAGWVLIEEMEDVVPQHVVCDERADHGDGRGHCV